MKLATSIFMLGFGIIIGITLVLSCGDDNPRRVDAADAPMCDCPAAEPPIASRVKAIITSDVIPHNTAHIAQSSACPLVPAGIVLNGGCTADLPPLGNIVLEQSNPGPNGWECSWSNPSNVDVPVHVIVRCLMAPQ
jgi:hypothetical protein